MKTFIVFYNNWIAADIIIDRLKPYGVNSHFQAGTGLLLFKGMHTAKFYAERIRELNTQANIWVMEYDPTSSWGWMPPPMWEWIKQT
jgi:hypothetical protein